MGNHNTSCVQILHYEKKFFQYRSNLQLEKHKSELNRIKIAIMTVNQLSRCSLSFVSKTNVFKMCHNDHINKCINIQ